MPMAGLELLYHEALGDFDVEARTSPAPLSPEVALLVRMHLDIRESEDSAWTFSNVVGGLFRGRRDYGSSHCATSYCLASWLVAPRSPALSPARRRLRRVAVMESLRRELSADDALAIYVEGVNVCVIPECGESDGWRHGLIEAARTLFGKSLDSLTDREWAELRRGAAR
jgi:hypothetical protein